MNEIEQLQMKLLETRVKRLEAQCEAIIANNKQMIRQINEANLSHLINYSATVNILQDKDIISTEEYQKSMIQVTSLADQQWAKKNDNLSNGS